MEIKKMWERWRLLGWLFVLIVGVLSCRTSVEMKGKEYFIEVQAHRGDRGSFPENTVPAFLSAVKKGADVLELDVVVSKDLQVVVSHEPYMAPEYMLLPNGQPIPGDGRRFNFYEMDYDSIRKFDAGSKGNKNFPGQQKMKVHKPLLKEAIIAVEQYIRENDLDPVTYNIELKSDKAQYGNFQPFPEDFVKLVMDVVYETGLEEKVILQCFDTKVLHLLHRNHRNIPLSFLVGSGGVDFNLSRLDFTPEIYSPDHRLLTGSTMVDYIKKLGMRVIPWTVNSKQNLRKMKRMGVDGIISDYPERVLEIL